MEVMPAESEHWIEISARRFVAASLDRAATALKDSNENASLLVRLDSLRERLRHNQLQLAVLGQFKRGKSTFINAMLGAALLPIAVVPLTGSDFHFVGFSGIRSRSVPGQSPS